MRIAVLSDVHANLAALSAVVAATADCDARWCLGDVVGYGPQPNECAALVRESCEIVLAGNHDLAAAGRADTLVFSRDAGRAMRWTREVLEPGVEAWLASLEPAAVVGRVGLYHGSPRDPVWEYILDPEAARAALQATTHDLVLVGHTHTALVARLDHDGRLTGRRGVEGLEIDLMGPRTLVNPGSVGQPRDGDARAAYVVLELDGDGVPLTLRFARAEYAIERTQQAIVTAGLPEHLADRLSFGM